MSSLTNVKRSVTGILSGLRSELKDIEKEVQTHGMTDETRERIATARNLIDQATSTSTEEIDAAFKSDLKAMIDRTEPSIADPTDVAALKAAAEKTFGETFHL